MRVGVLPCAVAACTLGLAVPGGTSFAVSFPAFLLATTHFAPPRDGDDVLRLRPAAAVSALGVSALLSWGESAVGLDTGSQQAALLSLMGSVAIPAGLANLRLPSGPSADGETITAGKRFDQEVEEEEEDGLAIKKKEALSARKSWDARLSWRLRKRQAGDTGDNPQKE